ncbi:hypothetical protein K3888_16150 [Dietzia aurantiaca]|uniref:hypothetical protein n=1 Tax=Dietzia aurantiaca TaxID=983873 RepID=UPI001E5417AE|nr:hypothetical protein [Dietzia aurantiaca]MCD2264228.1 hypothetical protein [Dietzia aurantiaca]
MSGLEFTASVIASVTWPVIIIVTIIIFRTKISAALEKLVDRVNDLSTLKAGSFEAAFNEIKRDEIIATVENASINDSDESDCKLSPSPTQESEAKDSQKQPTKGFDSPFHRDHDTDAKVEFKNLALDLASDQRLAIMGALEASPVSPVGSIITTWLEVERAINDLGHALKLPKGSTHNPNYSVREVAFSGALSEKDLNRLQNMQTLRNIAVHKKTDHISSSMADEYSLQAALLLTNINRLIRKAKGEALGNLH